MLLTQTNQFQFFLYGEITEGVLQCLIKTGFNTFLCNRQLVGGHTDVADLALLFCLQHTFIHAGSITGAVALIHAVELIEIQIICFQKL